MHHILLTRNHTHASIPTSRNMELEAGYFRFSSSTAEVHHCLYTQNWYVVART